MHRTHGTGSRGLGSGCLGNTKICYLYFSFSGNNNVLWFDIPVYNMIIMGNLQSCRYLNCNTGCLFDGQAAFSLNIILQSDPFHQLHHNIIDTVLITDIIYIYNIGMSKPGCCLSFLLKFLYKSVIVTEFLFQYFDCNVTVQLMIFSLEDLCHTAGSYFFQNLIAVSQNRSRLYHNPTSLLSISTNTTAILSSPPFLFALRISSAPISEISFF